MKKIMFLFLILSFVLSGPAVLFAQENTTEEMADDADDATDDTMEDADEYADEAMEGMEDMEDADEYADDAMAAMDMKGSDAQK